MIPLTVGIRAPLWLQLRSLDLSQNTFAEEDGDETAVLAELTALECLKLANCRMTQARLVGT